MPAVPVYDNLRGGLAQAPQPRLSNGGAASAQQTIQAGAAVQQAGGQLSAIMLDQVQQANQVRVADAMNQAVEARLKWTHDPQGGYTALQGRAALERPDGKPLDAEYTDKLQGDLERIAEGLGNDAQRRAFQVQTAQMAAQFRAGVQQHMAQADKAYKLSTAEGTIKVARDQAALEWDNPDAVAQGQNAIKAAAAEMGRLRGWSAQETLAYTVEQLSPAHQAVMASAIQAGKIDYAKAYMQQVNAELTPQARLTLKKHLDDGEQAVVASQTADAIWQHAGMGADRNAPVDLFAMEQKARAKFASDPAKAKATIDELRQRAQAWNSSQSEYHASNTTGVYRMIDQGSPLSRVRLSPEWQALPGDQQHRITLSLEQEAAARASRAASNEGRALAALQRADRMALLQNGGEYLRLGNPEVLASMTRAQVEASRATFGLEGAQHLLQKWDTLQKPGKIAEAKIDTQDFNHVAEGLGLKPYDPRKGEKEKRALGELQFKVEQLIDRAQQAKRAPLDRAEKMTLMQQEMARTVAVPTWFGISSDAVPVIQLTPDQAAKVAVPAADRTQIIEALRTMSQRQPDNPSWAPSEANVRRLYLQRQSPAAGLIPNAK